jgi:hypothetical protein
MAAKLEDLSASDRKRLASLSTAELIDSIERYSFTCRSGPLVNFTVWMELKARALAATRHGA